MLTPLGSNGGIKPRWNAGSYYSTNDNGRSTSSITLNSLQIVPLDCPLGGRIDTLGLEVTVAATAGGVIRFGAYTANAAGLPTNLIGDYGTIDSTTTGTKSLSVTQTFSDTRVWLCIVAQVANCTVRSIGSAVDRRVPVSSLASATGSNGINGLTYAGVTGALPSTLTAGSLGLSTQSPAIVFRAA